MKRRDFIHRTACVAGAAWLGGNSLARRSLALPALSRKFNAAEMATLGKTGIQTSLLAMGTGTVGSGHHSHQTAL
jgi:1-deoxyxylulose-5-phosphate synthase